MVARRERLVIRENVAWWVKRAIREKKVQLAQLVLPEMPAPMGKLDCKVILAHVVILDCAVR